MVNDTISLDKRIKYWKKVSQYGKITFKQSEHKLDVTLTDWNILLAYYNASQVNDLDIEKSTYDDLKSSGNLGLIENTNLRKMLSDYYLREEANSRTVWVQNPEYRKLIRSIVPIEFHEYYFQSCYEIYSGNESWFDGDCEPNLSKSELADLVTKIKSDEELNKSLRFWIIDRKIAIELAEKYMIRTKNIIRIISSNIKSCHSKNEEAKRAKQKLIDYYIEHDDRMQYKTYREKGLMIGSGPIEAAHRSVIQQRMKLSGQKWSIKGANAIANLRCYKQSGAWSFIKKVIAAAA